MDDDDDRALRRLRTEIRWYRNYKQPLLVVVASIAISQLHPPPGAPIGGGWLMRLQEDLHELSQLINGSGTSI